MIKITHIRVCCTDAFTLSGEDSKRSFLAVLGHKTVGIVVDVGEDVASVLVTGRTWKGTGFGGEKVVRDCQTLLKRL